MIDGKYICPVCDRRMEWKHYCAYCKSFVREPVYYTGPVANERKEELVHYQREVRQAKAAGRGSMGRRTGLREGLRRTAGENAAGRTARPAWEGRRQMQAGRSAGQQAAGQAATGRTAGRKSPLAAVAGIFLVIIAVLMVFQILSVLSVYREAGLMDYFPWGELCAAVLIRYLPFILIAAVIRVIAGRKGD